MFSRLSTITFAGLVLILSSDSIWAATPEEPVWPTLKQTYFGDRTIQDEAEDILSLEAPKRAEDAAIVPITIKSLKPQSQDNYIENIYIFIDNNPMPYSAKFHLSPELGNVDLSTRMRVDQYTYVRAVAEMNDGSLYMVSRFVKASGGCSAPAGKDAAAALARLGKMQLRMRQPSVGEPVQAQMIVSHPNYNGLQFDQKARKYIPAHYIDKMNISYNGQTLITVDAGISMSEDPSIRFTFTPQKHGKLEAKVHDTKSQEFKIEKEI